jgi:hypothetical protein
MISIAETAHFATAARKILSDEEREELTDFLVVRF